VLHGLTRFTRRQLLAAEILHVHVGTEAHVVGEVPAWVVWIIVNHDVIAIPEPAVAVAVIVRCYVKIKPVEPEPAGSAAAKPPAMAGTETTVEVAMRKWMIQVVMLIVPACIMADPSVMAIIVIDVGCIGMAFMITQVRVILGCPWSSMEFRRT